MIIEHSLLAFDGKCIVILEAKNHGWYFYSDGFDVLKALFSIPGLSKFKMGKLFLESAGNGLYKCWTEKDFPEIDDLAKLKNIFKNLPADTFIYSMEITSERFNISIHDGRDFNIFLSSTVSDNLITIKEIIKTNFSFSEEDAARIIIVLTQNQNKYVIINQEGKVENIYKDFDDYLAANKN